MLRRLALVLLIAALLPIGLIAQAPDADPLVGIYLCEGLNHDGVTYRAVVEIVANGPAYELRWEMIGNPQRNVGIALRQDDVLSVIFQTEAGSIGLSSYAIERAEKGVTLRGRWLVPGLAVISRETMTKTAARSLDELRQQRGL